jgi:hypothetical protein
MFTGFSRHVVIHRVKITVKSEFGKVLFQMVEVI